MEPLGPSDPVRMGPYELLGRLGAGGMGTVYLGRAASGVLAAVKVVHPQLAMDGEFRSRFHREVATARMVSGHYTAPVIDADLDADRPWLATAYLPGPTLAQSIRAHGPLPEASVRSLAVGLADALASIHAVGLVHRDVKPSNVILAAGGPRVIDFGIARAAESDTRITRTGLSIGTQGYVAPEVLEGKPISAASDVFSLGVLLAFAATAKHPFGDDGSVAGVIRILTTEPHLADVPPGLREVIEGCLRKNPEQRLGLAAVSAGLRAVPSGAPEGIGWLPEPVRTSIMQAPPAPVAPLGSASVSPARPTPTLVAPAPQPYGVAPPMPTTPFNSQRPALAPPSQPTGHPHPQLRTWVLPVSILAAVVLLATIGIVAAIALGNNDKDNSSGVAPTTTPSVEPTASPDVSPSQTAGNSQTGGNSPPANPTGEAGTLTGGDLALYNSVSHRGFTGDCFPPQEHYQGTSGEIDCDGGGLKYRVQFLRFVSEAELDNYFDILARSVDRPGASCGTGGEFDGVWANSDGVRLGLLNCAATDTNDFRMSWGYDSTYTVCQIFDNDPAKVQDWWDKYGYFAP